MDMIWQATLDGYVKLLYDNDPQGPLLESIRDFEKRFCQVAEENSGNPDVAGVLSRTGLQDEYNRLYMASINRNNDYNSVSAEEQPQVFDYRKEQLKKLQEEVVDIEDMSSGISIMDFGLNDFRMDLVEYIKTHPEIERAPFGLNAVTRCKENTPPGVIFVLKNRTGNINIDNQNRLHPFYMIYVDMDGNVITDHLSPKKLLDKMRYLAREEESPIPSVYKPFNKETRDGRNMKTYSNLLDKAIDSVIEKKSESDAKTFLSGGQISFINTLMKGLDDFDEK